MSSNEHQKSSSRYPTRRGATSSASNASVNNRSSSPPPAATTPTRPHRAARAAAAAKPVVIDDDNDDQDEEKSSSSSSSYSGDEELKISKTTPPNTRAKRTTVKSSSSTTSSSSSSVNHKSAMNNQQRGGGGVKIDPDVVAQLESITSLSRAECIGMLEACQGKLDKAIDLHFGGGSSSATNHHQTTSSSSSSAAAAAATSSSRSGGAKSSIATSNGGGAASSTALLGKNQNNKRPIHAGAGDDFNDESSSNSSASASANGDDNVRAPIPQKSEKLLDHDPYALSLEPKSKRIRSVFDGYDHFNEMTQDGGAPSSSNSSKMKSLAAMYRPPIELLFRGSFEAAKIQGNQSNKWVMVNLQCQDDFACSLLNRDLWRDDTVKEIVKGNFVFVQIYSDSLDGKKIVNYYRVKQFPFVAILDPRTGENVHQFNSSKLDALMFCEKVTQFLYENGDGPNKEAQDEDETVATAKKKELVDDEIVICDEDNNKKEKTETKKKEKASEIIQRAEIFDKSTSGSEDTSPSPKTKSKKTKKVNDEDDDDNDQETSFSQINGDDTTNKKDCFIRVMCPNGERIDWSTSGDAPFKSLVDHLRKRGYKKSSYELIERLMPSVVASPATSHEVMPSTSSQISNELSNMVISSTNHSRNLFNLVATDSSLTFRRLNLYPRVFLLLQEI